MPPKLGKHLNRKLWYLLFNLAQRNRKFNSNLLWQDLKRSHWHVVTWYMENTDTWAVPISLLWAHKEALTKNMPDLYCPLWNFIELEKYCVNDEYLARFILSETFSLQCETWHLHAYILSRDKKNTVSRRLNLLDLFSERKIWSHIR